MSCHRKKLYCAGPWSRFPWRTTNTAFPIESEAKVVATFFFIYSASFLYLILNWLLKQRRLTFLLLERKLNILLIIMSVIYLFFNLPANCPICLKSLFIQEFAKIDQNPVLIEQVYLSLFSKQSSMTVHKFGAKMSRRQATARLRKFYRFGKMSTYLFVSSS